MNLLLFVVIGLAAIGGVFVFGVLTAILLDVVQDRAHRLRVARAVAEGWNEPRISANWSIVNSDDVFYDGVSGVKASADRGVPVRDYTKHARQQQRRVEEAWLAGIAQEKRRERTAEATAQLN